MSVTVDHNLCSSNDARLIALQNEVIFPPHMRPAILKRFLLPPEPVAGEMAFGNPLNCAIPAAVKLSVFVISSKTLLKR